MAKKKAERGEPPATPEPEKVIYDPKKHKKVPDRTFSEICSLLEELAYSADELTQPPLDSGVEHVFDSRKMSFQIDSPEDVADAMIELLFGADILAREKTRRGPKGYEESDRILVLEARAVSQQENITLNEAYFRVAHKAQRKSEDTDDESIVRRLEDVHQKMSHEEKNQAKATSVADSVSDSAFLYDAVSLDYLLIDNWLRRHRQHLIRHLS